MDPIRAATRELLRTRGPLPLEELVGLLVADGHTLAEDPDALDEHLFPFHEPDWSPVELADGPWPTGTPCSTGWC